MAEDAYLLAFWVVGWIVGGFVCVGVVSGYIVGFIWIGGSAIRPCLGRQVVLVALTGRRQLGNLRAWSRCTRLISKRSQDQDDNCRRDQIFS